MRRKRNVRKKSVRRHNWFGKVLQRIAGKKRVSPYAIKPQVPKRKLIKRKRTLKKRLKIAAVGVAVAAALTTGAVKIMHRPKVPEALMQERMRAQLFILRRKATFNEFGYNMSPERAAKVIEAINKYTKKYDENKAMVFGILNYEGGFCPTARGRADPNDYGMGQIRKESLETVNKWLVMKGEQPILENLVFSKEPSIEAQVRATVAYLDWIREHITYKGSRKKFLELPLEKQEDLIILAYRKGLRYVQKYGIKEKDKGYVSRVRASMGRFNSYDPVQRIRTVFEKYRKSNLPAERVFRNIELELSARVGPAERWREMVPGIKEGYVNWTLYLPEKEPMTRELRKLWDEKHRKKQNK